MTRRTVLTSRQRSALFSLPEHEAELLRHYTLSDEDLENIAARRRPRNKVAAEVDVLRAERERLRYPAPGMGEREREGLHGVSDIEIIATCPSMAATSCCCDVVLRSTALAYAVF